MIVNVLLTPSHNPSMDREWNDCPSSRSPLSLKGRRLILESKAPILMGLNVKGLQDLQS